MYNLRAFLKQCLTTAVQFFGLTEDILTQLHQTTSEMCINANCGQLMRSTPGTGLACGVDKYIDVPE